MVGRFVQRIIRGQITHHHLQFKIDGWVAICPVQYFVKLELGALVWLQTFHHGYSITLQSYYSLVLGVHGQGHVPALPTPKIYTPVQLFL